MPGTSRPGGPGGPLSHGAATGGGLTRPRAPRPLSRVGRAKPAVGRDPRRPHQFRPVRVFVARDGRDDQQNLTGFAGLTCRGAFSPRPQNRPGGSGSFNVSEFPARAENSQLASSIAHPARPGWCGGRDFSDRRLKIRAGSGCNAWAKLTERRTTPRRACRADTRGAATARARPWRNRRRGSRSLAVTAPATHGPCLRPAPARTAGTSGTRRTAGCRRAASSTGRGAPGTAGSRRSPGRCRTSGGR